MCDRDRFAGRVGCSQSQRGTGSGAPTAQLQQKHALTPSPPDCLHRPPPPRCPCLAALQGAAGVSVPLRGHPALWHRRLPAGPPAAPPAGDQGAPAGLGAAWLVGPAGCLAGVWAALLFCYLPVLSLSSCHPDCPSVNPLPACHATATARLPWVQEDDQDIQQEGLDSLTVDELRQACRWGAQACGVCVVH